MDLSVWVFHLLPCQPGHHAATTTRL
jgi:hypothetical protein